MEYGVGPMVGGRIGLATSEATATLPQIDCTLLPISFARGKGLGAEEAELAAGEAAYDFFLGFQFVFF